MRTHALLLATLIILAAGPVAAQPDDGDLQQPHRVASGVWVLTQSRFQVQPIGNVTVIEQTHGLVLVDTGGSPGSGRRIVQMVKAISRKPVKAVIVTHWHGDHTQGLSEILKAWPETRTIAARATQVHLRDPATMNSPASPDAHADAALGKQLAGFADYARQMAAKATEPGEKAGWAASERLFVRYAADMRGVLTLPVAESFETALSLPDASNPVEVLFLGRANTDGDAVVWLPATKVLVTGDIVVSPFPFGFGSYPADWVATLARLESYDFRSLVPGHGPPQRDRTYLARLSAALRDVRNQVGLLARQGLSLADVRHRIDVSNQLRTFAGDDPWLRRWTKEYWVNPIVTSAYKEARGEPIVQSLKGG